MGLMITGTNVSEHDHDKADTQQQMGSHLGRLAETRLGWPDWIKLQWSSSFAYFYVIQADTWSVRSCWACEWICTKQKSGWRWNRMWHDTGVSFSLETSFKYKAWVFCYRNTSRSGPKPHELKVKHSGKHQETPGLPEQKYIFQLFGA